jgi:hypothetical protein
MNEPNDDLRLRELLREWPGNQPLPPQFQERVWQRIESAEQMPTTTLARAFSRRLAALFARPAFAVAWVSLLLVLGMGTGYFWGGHDATRSEAQLSNHYAASINPDIADNR